MCADIEIATGKYEMAFDRLIEAVKSFTGDDRDKAKTHLISLFNLVDPTDPRLVKARSKLASALFWKILKKVFTQRASRDTSA